MKLQAAVLGLVVVALASTASADPLTDRRPRAASVSVCTDQFLLTLAEPDQIAAVSWQAARPRSPVRHLATGYPSIRGSAEELLAVETDLVIFDPYGHPDTSLRLEELGTEVVRLGPITSVADVETELRHLADALGVSQRGADLAEALAARRLELAQQADRLQNRPRALYVVPGGGGAGADTFIDEVIRLGGFENLQAELGFAGWGRIPLERLIENPPDVIIMTFFDTSDPSLLDGFGRHPRFRELIETTPIITVPAAPWLCAGPYLLDAAEYLAAERERMFPGGAVVRGDGS